MKTSDGLTSFLRWWRRKCLRRNNVFVLFKVTARQALSNPIKIQMKKFLIFQRGVDVVVVVAKKNFWKRFFEAHTNNFVKIAHSVSLSLSLSLSHSHTHTHTHTHSFFLFIFISFKNGSLPSVRINNYDRYDHMEIFLS